MIRLLHGDCRDVLKTLPDESVHCVVTSPPYWGLRDYGIGENAFGLEPTCQLYVEHAVEIFREVRRVLRKDGTLWLNLGDSYAGAPVGSFNGGSERFGWKKYKEGHAQSGVINKLVASSLKPKDLCGIPWRVAFALQADGWWLRQDIIWSKPNPMPESVTDRCTKAHEYLFMLSKSERYFYDAEAIKEPMKDVSLQRLSQPNVLEQPGGPKDPKSGNRSHKKAINNQAERLIRHEKWKTRFEGWDEFDKSLGRNKRSVWEIATAPFSEAHFATFPPALIEPCILAGCPQECCAKCGMPWVRQTEYGRVVSTGGSNDGQRAANLSVLGPRGDTKLSDSYIAGKFEQREKLTIGWSPSCSCNAGTVPGVCLDPFGGAGTTGLVADRLGRNAVLIELNPEYAAMAERRIRQDAGMFAEVSA